MSDLTIADYEEVLDDKRRLTKRLDEAIFGVGGAMQPSLCDVVSSVERLCREFGLSHLIAVSPTMDRFYNNPPPPANP